MKKMGIKFLIILLIISIITGTCCYINNKKKKNNLNDELSFSGLDDMNLQNYLIENLYSGLNSNFSSDDYNIENITTTYISKEYIEELNFNSKSNVFFGYTLAELSNQFNGKKYVFDVDENNKTIVKEFEDYNNIYGQMIKNVVIGSGVILVCVTISVTTGGTMSIVFATSAKTATELAVTSMALTTTFSSAIEYYNTGNLEQSIEKGLLDGTDSFKWGAILGSVTGGITESVTQINAAKELKNMNFIERGARSESRALKKYGGKEQISYLNGKEVSLNEVGATRPDIIRQINGKIEAIEVKNYNLDSYVSREHLYKELNRQVTDRVNNLPLGSKQRIVLDVQGRNYTKARIKEVISGIQNACKNVYKDIPIDIMT